MCKVVIVCTFGELSTVTGTKTSRHFTWWGNNDWSSLYSLDRVQPYYCVARFVAVKLLKVNASETLASKVSASFRHCAYVMEAKTELYSTSLLEPTLAPRPKAKDVLPSTSAHFSLLQSFASNFEPGFVPLVYKIIVKRW